MRNSSPIPLHETLSRACPPTQPAQKIGSNPALPGSANAPSTWKRLYAATLRLRNILKVAHSLDPYLRLKLTPVVGEGEGEADGPWLLGASNRTPSTISQTSFAPCGPPRRFTKYRRRPPRLLMGEGQPLNDIVARFQAAFLVCTIPTKTQSQNRLITRDSRRA